MNVDLSELKFTFAEENGNIEYEPIISFYNDVTKKNYLVYTDNTTDEEGNLNTYASSYDPADPKMVLQPIETEAEWKNIEQYLDSYWGGN